MCLLDCHSASALTVTSNRLRTGGPGQETNGHLDEVFIRSGACSSICGAVDQDGVVLDTLVQHAPHPDAPINAVAEKQIIGAKDLPTEVRAATGGKGADVVFDLVGGVMFRNALNSLALRGRLVEIAATGQREASFDLPDFYHNESRLFGVDTLKRNLTASAEVLDALIPGFAAGDYRAAPIAETCGLSEAQEAYRKVASGAPGRIVLRPQE